MKTLLRIAALITLGLVAGRMLHGGRHGSDAAAACRAPRPTRACMACPLRVRCPGLRAAIPPQNDPPATHAPASGNGSGPDIRQRTP